jgi:hypothetical protein
MSENDSFEQGPEQPAEELGSLSGTGITGCEEKQSRPPDVSGHDFSRAVSDVESTRALAPAGNASRPECAGKLELHPEPHGSDQFTPAEPSERLLFQSFTQPAIVPPARIPHLGHLALLVALASIGLLCSTMLVLAGVHLHLFGVATLD